MSAISEENLQRIKTLKKRLLDRQIWLSTEGLKLEIDFVTQARALKQFVIGLSIAIVGVAFPILVGSVKETSQDMLLVSFFMFSVVTLWGLLSLIIPTLKEQYEMPKVNRHHTTQIGLLIKELQEIEQMSENSEAGKRYLALETRYKHLDLGETTLIELLLIRYQDTILYAIFIVAFVLMVTATYMALRN